MCVCVYPSKEVAGEEKERGKEGREREVGCHPLKKKQKKQELGKESRQITALCDRSDTEP